MIFETIHLPPVYAASSHDQPDEYYINRLHLLRSMMNNCVILEDAHQSVATILFKHIEQWPIKYRRPAFELLKQLQLRHRFVPVPLATCLSGCAQDACSHYAQLAQAAPEAPVIVPDVCHCTSLCRSDNKRYLTAAEYFLSSYSTAHQEGACIDLAHAQWSAERFEQEVWSPLFRNATRVKLIDGQLGKSLSTAFRKNPSTFHNRVDLKDLVPNYAFGLEWIFEQFLKHSRRPRHFELLTTLNVRGYGQRTPEVVTDLRNTVAPLRRVAQRLSQQHHFELRIDVLLPTRDTVFRHDRFLITDQTMITIGRGIDLLDPRTRRVRDVLMVQLSAADAARKLDTEIRRLDRLHF